MTKKKPLVKVFIRIALVMICITVVSPFVMYFGVSSNNSTNCEEWYIRNEQTQMCEEVIDQTDWDIKIDTQESCEAQSGTWYEANQVCILPTE